MIINIQKRMDQELLQPRRPIAVHKVRAVNVAQVGQVLVPLSHIRGVQRMTHAPIRAEEIQATETRQRHRQRNLFLLKQAKRHRKRKTIRLVLVLPVAVLTQVRAAIRVRSPAKTQNTKQKRCIQEAVRWY